MEKAVVESMSIKNVIWVFSPQGGLYISLGGEVQPSTLDPDPPIFDTLFNTFYSKNHTLVKACAKKKVLCLKELRHDILSHFMTAYDFIYKFLYFFFTLEEFCYEANRKLPPFKMLLNYICILT